MGLAVQCEEAHTRTPADGGTVFSTRHSGTDERFLAEVQLDVTRIARELRSPFVTLDIFFLGYLLKLARFGFFTFGPVTLDVRLLEEIVVRTAPSDPGFSGAPSYSDDCVRFFSALTEEVRRSGQRRVDELHFLLAFMRTNEGLPGRVFAELGVRPEQVEEYARSLVAPGGAPERLYSPEDAAAYLGVHVKTVRAWIRAGRLPASRLAGQRALRIRASDLQGVLEPVDPVEFTEGAGQQE